MITSNSNRNIVTADLYSIATSGVNASNQLLTTTGNNIANVNTEGYVREQTIFEGQLYGGVGESTTSRVLNTFAQNQLRRDTTMQSEFQTYYDKTSVLDNLFASEANSISSSMSRFFAAIQTATDDPTSMAARQVVLGEAELMVSQIGIVSNFLDEREDEVNKEFEATIGVANTLIQSISDLNESIRSIQGNNPNSEPGALKNERDQAIMELAELVSIETRVDADDGGVLVNLSSGESLVLQDGSFNVFTVSNDADLSYTSLQLTSDDNVTSLNIHETDMGGTLGGLFRYRDEVLESSRRELGQIALALTDAVNTQNKLGMDFDQQLGTDIFTRPEVTGLKYPDNSDPSLLVSGRMTAGESSSLTSADYRVTVDGTTSGTPDTIDITVALVNADGTPVTDTDGNAITQSYSGLIAEEGTFNSVIGGIELEFASGDAYAVGDEFLLQPTKEAASEIELAITRPEDLAFASPIRVEGNINNLGDTEVTSSSVTNTTVDNTFADLGASAFDGAGGIHSAGSSPTGAGGVGAPAEIYFTSATDYQVLDDAGNVITEVSGATSFSNMLAQAEASGTGPAWPSEFSAMDNYPGYDFSLQGEPKAGDSFTIGYNTDGLSDTSNGLALANLQTADSMLLNNNGAGNLVTFHESYSNIVTDIGQKASSADISLQAADALKSQSNNWFQSVSGVSLDEEAANLVKYQQSYAASARLLSTAQDLFNTILSVVS
ncbi:flagellar basal body rod C-terminal domain-containing protein [uncultured Paraglaciecola sp.]|uniref:FlgK family flagellar hook-associated protein n=1 Tax=uncultured Paraglaciecola sp. TaxID=1765024 RepID=UPI00259A0D70|nr:flagellar basal body rod C-terminal domain-containing protein [uncultured Paraglaciecola sp.]